MRIPRKGLLRQFYVDLVQRRARVRVHTAAERTVTTPRPVFLVGAYRSATTLLRYIVDSHPHIACPPESDFLAPLHALLAPGRPKTGLESMGYDTDHVLSRVQLFADYFFANYAASHGKQRWADKSPTYVEHLDFLDAVFPDGQFVFIHRHPLDQIHSHTRGGTHTNAFVERHRRLPGEDVRLPAARYWVECTTTIRKFVESHDRCLQLRYEDLCADPVAVTQGLFDFLDEPWVPAVLEYAAAPHDVGMEAARTRAMSGFRLRTGGYHEWPRGILTACREIVDEPARSLGYFRD